ncbi:MAG TPA: hypothetical protein VK213_12040 [Bacteroidales bacterium]|nr:hypothetical protein [Bacteroidales bacterium]
MNKGNKIKAYIIMLSWLMIFAHSVLPHNHIDADILPTNGSVDADKSVCLHFVCDCSSDEESCKISGLLFYKFQDDTFIQAEWDSLIEPVTVFSKYYSCPGSVFLCIDYTGVVSPRAPPVA